MTLQSFRLASTGMLKVPVSASTLGTNGTPTTLVSRFGLIFRERRLTGPLDDFSGITVSEGDSILMTVVATSKTSGTATIENLTTGVTVSETFTDVTDGSLCEYDAEWIVEDFEECTGSSCELVPFADFGTVTFTDVSAVQSGSTVTPADATIIDIEQNNQVLTSCSASASEVTCTYV